HARSLDETEAAAIDCAAVIGLLAWNRDEPAVQRVVPAVIAADEVLRVPLLAAAQRVATMATAVEQDIDVAVVVADDDHLILADVVDEVVARLRDLRLVAHEVPATSEDPFELEFVDLLVREDAPIEHAGGGVEHGHDVRFVPGAGGLSCVRHSG